MTSALDYRYPAIQGEFETELEDEYEDEMEGEFEDEAFLGGLAKIAGSLLGETELEDEYELETELEEESEEELEGELEDEQELEFEFEAEAEAELEAEGELEEEFEAELEEEAEGFVNPVRRIYRDAEVMANLATRARDTESEMEAEAFIGALVPLAARLIPRAASVLARNAPALVKGATRIVRGLRRNPQTRRLVQAMPVVLQRTAQSLADQAASGRPIDASRVVGTLATMTGRVLRGPRRRRAVRAVDVFNRRWRRRAYWARRRGAHYRRSPYPSGARRTPMLGSARPRTTLRRRASRPPSMRAGMTRRAGANRARRR